MEEFKRISKASRCQASNLDRRRAPLKLRPEKKEEKAKKKKKKKKKKKNKKKKKDYKSTEKIY
jgi:hypothetical protein